MYPIVKFKKLSSRARMPQYATPGSACFDFFAVMEEGDQHVMKHNQPFLVDTKLAIELPADHVLLIFSRSGQGFNYGVRLSNSVGIIDSDYRGSIKVSLISDSPTNAGSMTVQHGDKIAQGMILPLPILTFMEVNELSDTARGTGGFGSTDVKAIAANDEGKFNDIASN